MKDRKFHNKKLSKNYPPPGVLADEAWGEMNKMLDANLQPPPQSHGGFKFPGGNVLMYSAVLISAISIIVLINYKKHVDVKRSVEKNIQANNIKVENFASLQSDTSQQFNNVKSKSEQENESDTGLINSSSVKQNLSEDTNTQQLNAARKNVTSLLNDTANLSSNKINQTANKANAISKTGNNNFQKENKLSAEKNNHFKKDKEGNSVIKPGRTNKIYDADKTKQNIYVRDHNNFAGARKYNLSPGTPSNTINKHVVNEIKFSDTSLSSIIAATLAEFITSNAQKNLDSSYLQTMKNRLREVASSKKDRSKSKAKIKENTEKISNGFDYGLKWNVPIPMQPASNYFTGTNAKSEPYNILLPELWISKGFNNKSKVFLEINMNQQFFTGRSQVAAFTTFMSPRDTTLQRISVYKISGFGTTLEYSYNIYKHWAVALGINYSINRKALMNKQNISFSNGSILSDSLYGIKRSSPDWQYINKSMLASNLEIYYIFRRLNLGANVYLPFSNMRVYGNKNIHPVNTQLFLRWNIKKN